MFCFQCEQTAKHQGCLIQGVCGKNNTTANLQDLLLYELKGLSHIVLKTNIFPKEAKKTLLKGLFLTVTNVNFDDDFLIEKIKKVDKLKHKIAQECLSNPKNCNITPDIAFKVAENKKDILIQAQEHSLSIDKKIENEDTFSLKSLLTIGLKGMAAYAYHAKELGYENDEVYDFIADSLFATLDPNMSQEGLLNLCLKCGEINFRVLELLDLAHTATFGQPVPTKVRTTPVKGKAILVSGHDLKHLEEILKQTSDQGINVYTHGEMLTAHSYPMLHKYPHLVGNYGGAWQDQKTEFAKFPGAIIMTTNCIQNPNGYSDHIFTSGLVSWSEVEHIKDLDFTPAINKAKELEGFPFDDREEYITIGFGHNALQEASPKIIENIKNGAIEHLFLVGGCDGAKTGRNYYTEIAQQIPSNCLVLTLACGKYRFNKLEFGDINGIPRLIDIGQCNDAYSAIQIAIALSKVFNCPINDLPLSFILSWYEQKAVCILLTLLSLNVKNIKIGPSLPAFISPNILKLLVDKFNIQPITTPQQDISSCLKH